MKLGKTFEEFEALNGISVKDILSVFEAVSQAFPMIISANLTRNTYTMIKDDGFLVGELPMRGKYDDLIDFGVENVHPNYQSLFLQSFSRENLLQSFGQGKKEVVAKLYQKGRSNQYQWVSTHVIRVQDRDGDVCEICINKILNEGKMGEPMRISRAPY